MLQNQFNLARLWNRLAFVRLSEPFRGGTGTNHRISADMLEILQLKNEDYQVAELTLILAELTLLVTEPIARNDNNKQSN